MAEEDVVAPSEATDEVVETEQETTEGQVEGQPAENEAETDETTSENAENEADDKKSPAKARRERRKAEMERLKREAEDAKTAAEQAAERLKKIQEAASAAQPPQERDFADYNDYLVAMAAHQSVAALDKREMTTLEEQAEMARQRAQQIEAERARELNSAWQEQVSDAKARYSDWEQVAMNPNLPISDTMANLIKSSDAGADLSYYLGSHPDEAARIYRMEPLEAAMAMGAIQSRLSLPKARTQSEAPEPINPVKPKAHPGTKDPEKMSIEEYRKWRMGQ